MDVSLGCSVTKNGTPFLTNSLVYHNCDATAVAYIEAAGKNLVESSLHGKEANTGEFGVVLNAAVDGVPAGPDTVANMDEKQFFALERKLASIILLLVDDSEHANKKKKAGQPVSATELTKKHGWK